MPQLHSQSFFKKLCFSALITALFFACLEGSFRLIGIGSPEELADYIAVWDVHWKNDFFLGDARQPGFNRDGVRDREHALAKPPGVTRIACIGDSVTFGYKLPASQAYSSLLEQKLLTQGKRVEVFNIAMPGWTTRQQRYGYERIARPYSPDLVILGVCLNDVAEMKVNLTAPPPQITSLLYQNTNLGRWLLRPHAREIYRVEELFERANEPRIQEGWQLLFDEVEQIARAVSNDGGEFVVLLFPFRMQVEPNPPQAIPQQLFRDYCAHKSIRYLDGLEALAPLGAEGFVDYDHLSLLGAHAIAEQVILQGMHHLTDEHPVPLSVPAK